MQYHFLGRNWTSLARTRDTQATAWWLCILPPRPSSKMLQCRPQLRPRNKLPRRSTIRFSIGTATRTSRWAMTVGNVHFTICPTANAPVSHNFECRYFLAWCAKTRGNRGAGKKSHSKLAVMHERSPIITSVREFANIRVLRSANVGSMPRGSEIRVRGEIARLRVAHVGMIGP